MEKLLVVTTIVDPTTNMQRTETMLLNILHCTRQTPKTTNYLGQNATVPKLINKV